MNNPTPHIPPSFDSIRNIGLGFRASKCVLSAVSLGLFTQLAAAPMDEITLRGKLGLHPRGARDFFDALVALGLLTREGGMYANTAESAYYLDRGKDTYMGGFLEMCDNRLYGIWGSLGQALQTGEVQSEVESGGDLFSAIYSSPDKLQRFLHAMTALSTATARALAQKFPWDRASRFVDVGTAQGAAAVEIARQHPHLRGIGMDLPVVAPIFERFIAQHGLTKRLSFEARDFFKEPLPTADVIVMGQILHDWGLETRRMLLSKAYDALPAGGSLVVCETLIDDERRSAVAGLLMSVNMVVATPEGQNFTGEDCQRWMREAGFAQTQVEHLAGPDWMVVATK